MCSSVLLIYIFSLLFTSQNFIPSRMSSRTRRACTGRLTFHFQCPTEMYPLWNEFIIFWCVIVENTKTYCIYSNCAALWYYLKGFIFVSGNNFNCATPSNSTAPYLLYALITSVFMPEIFINLSKK